MIRNRYNEVPLMSNKSSNTSNTRAKVVVLFLPLVCGGGGGGGVLCFVSVLLHIT